MWQNAVMAGVWVGFLVLFFFFFLLSALEEEEDNCLSVHCQSEL